VWSKSTISEPDARRRDRNKQVKANQPPSKRTSQESQMSKKKKEKDSGSEG
jgi:hypothetical protein